jgi:hypothetical protein
MRRLLAAGEVTVQTEGNVNVQKEIRGLMSKSRDLDLVESINGFSRQSAAVSTTEVIPRTLPEERQLLGA